MTGDRVPDIHNKVRGRLDALAAGGPDPGSQMPEHIRAAILAGHVAQVVIYCDGCGVEESGDYIGETREERFTAARRYLVETKGWQTPPGADWCPTCAQEMHLQWLADQS